jgi:hypothetical protein
MSKLDCQHPNVYPNCKTCPTNRKLDPIEFERRSVTIASEGYIIVLKSLDALAQTIADLMCRSDDGKRP